MSEAQSRTRKTQQILTEDAIENVVGGVDIAEVAERQILVEV